MPYAAQASIYSDTLPWLAKGSSWLVVAACSTICFRQAYSERAKLIINAMNHGMACAGSRLEAQAMQLHRSAKGRTTAGNVHGLERDGQFSVYQRALQSTQSFAPREHMTWPAHYHHHVIVNQQALPRQHPVGLQLIQQGHCTVQVVDHVMREAQGSRLTSTCCSTLSTCISCPLISKWEGAGGVMIFFW